MTHLCENRPTALAIAALAVFLGFGLPARAQLVPADSADNRFELTDTVQLDRADSTVLGQFQRVKAYLADRQWDEAVETLRQLAESAEGRLMGVTERRFVSLGEYCQWQLASLPPEALAGYRRRVDPLARKWYEDGVARRDRRMLEQVINEAFASHWGDKALMALGEMALESGDYVAARWNWERVLPAQPPAGVVNTWPGYPDSEIDPAAVRARLVLVSILEGSPGRAREELTQFTRLHGQARGRLGGRDVNYAEALGTMLAESAAWPAPHASADWPTFAGNFTRNRIAPGKIDVGNVGWRLTLRTAAEAGNLAADLKEQPIGEDPRWPLSFFPIAVGNMIMVANEREVLVVRADTGKAAWGPEDAGPTAAVVYQHPDAAASLMRPRTALGTPRFTLTAFGNRLYVHVGSTVTSRPQEDAAAGSGGSLVALDLAAEGRLAWKIDAEEGWALEGAPVADETSIYLALRHNDIRPQQYVACFDAQSGRQRWRRFLCAAETPARGSLPQRTHNLLALAGRTLYCNTNLGAVAALDTAEGAIRWVSLYPRALRGDLLRPAAHWQRDVNPVLVDRGILLVAPADSPRIFAFDAAGGQILWQTGEEVADVTHLLGTTEEHLIAGGQRLYWIGLKDDDRGRVKHRWPDGPERPGYGRGLLAADAVVWPTLDKLYLFDRKTAEPKKVFDLAGRGAGGGNLLVVDGRLLVATGRELVAFRRSGGKIERTPKGTIAWNPATTSKPYTN